MDVRNGNVSLPANDFRRFKLEIEQVLDQRESPFLELTERSQDGRKEPRIEVSEIERRPFRIDRIDLWRTVEKQSALKPRQTSNPIQALQIEQDVKEKVTRINVWSYREPLTGFTLETPSQLQPRCQGACSGHRGRADRLAGGRAWDGSPVPVPGISQGRVAGPLCGEAERVVSDRHRERGQSSPGDHVGAGGGELVSPGFSGRGRASLPARLRLRHRPVASVRHRGRAGLTRPWLPADRGRPGEPGDESRLPQWDRIGQAAEQLDRPLPGSGSDDRRARLGLAPGRETDQETSRRRYVANSRGPSSAHRDKAGGPIRSCLRPARILDRRPLETTGHRLGPARRYLGRDRLSR